MSNHVANLVETWLQQGDDQRAEQAITAMAGTPGAFGPGLSSAILALGHVAQEVRADASRSPERREELARCCLKAATKLIDAGIANAQHPEGYHRWARFLTSCPQVELRDPGRALEMAEKAVQGAPIVVRYRQTLGAAHYRAGNWQEARHALHEADRLQPAANPATWLLLAMTYWQSGERETARVWYEKAVRWQSRQARQSGELRRLVAETAELLGVTASPAGEPNALDSENGN
jgi:tetratricopeptide (TPR) repeat protein